jgi:hypothetical protein
MPFLHKLKQRSVTKQTTNDGAHRAMLPEEPAIHTSSEIEEFNHLSTHTPLRGILKRSFNPVNVTSTPDRFSNDPIVQSTTADQRPNTDQLDISSAEPKNLANAPTSPFIAPAKQNAVAESLDAGLGPQKPYQWRYLALQPPSQTHSPIGQSRPMASGMSISSIQILLGSVKALSRRSNQRDLEWHGDVWLGKTRAESVERLIKVSTEKLNSA